MMHPALVIGDDSMEKRVPLLLEFSKQPLRNFESMPLVVFHLAETSRNSKSSTIIFLDTSIAYVGFLNDFEKKYSSVLLCEFADRLNVFRVNTRPWGLTFSTYAMQILRFLKGNFLRTVRAMALKFRLASLPFWPKT